MCARFFPPFFICVFYCYLFIFFGKRVELIRFTVPHHIRPESRLFSNKTENITKPSCNILRNGGKNQFLTLLLLVRGKISFSSSLGVTITLLVIRTNLCFITGQSTQHRALKSDMFSSIADLSRLSSIRN